jgi:hypothetical protein
VRFLYFWILQMHPPRFRARFADEMMLLFEDAAATRSGFRMTLDVAGSLLRQWVLRSENWKPVSRPHSVASTSGAVPQFTSLDSSGLRLPVLIVGGLLTIMAFTAIPILLSYGRQISEDSGWGLWQKNRSLDHYSEEGRMSSVVDVRPFGVSNSAAVRSETPAESRFLEWLQIFNTGDLRTMNAFYMAHTARSPNRAFTAEQDVRAWHALFQQSGPLTIRALTQYGFYGLVAICEDGNSTRWQVSLNVDSASPRLMVGIDIRKLSSGLMSRQLK